MTKAAYTPWTEERLYQALNGHATKEEATMIALGPAMAAILKRLVDGRDTREPQVPDDSKAHQTWRICQDARAILAKIEGE